MAVESPPTDSSTSSHAIPVVHVSAYVDLPLGAVLDRMVPAVADELLSAAFRAAVGGAGDVEVAVRAAGPTWVSSGHVRVPVTWRIERPEAATASTGAATISLLVVQSGADAITELLAVVPIPPEGELRSTAEFHKVLDQVARHLEADA